MITLFAAPERQQNNSTLSVENISLSQFVVLPTPGWIYFRLEIVSIDSGSEVIVITESYNGSNNTARMESTFTEVGLHETGFARGDYDNTTLITGSIQTVGRARFSFSILHLDRGEATEEWL